MNDTIETHKDRPIISCPTYKGTVTVWEVYSDGQFRFVVTLNEDNTSTSGQIYQSSISFERACGFANGVWFATEILRNQ